MMTTLLSLFEDSAALVDNPMFGHEIKWSSLGVEQKYIIFMTGRCGSTWLTHLLTDSGFLGQPEEFFNEEFIPHFCRGRSIAKFREYLPQVITKYKGSRHFGFELDPIRYKALSTITRFTEVFGGPKTTTFFMTRTDVLSQAYSFAVAKQTGRWHELSASGNTAAATDENISDGSLWTELFLILEQEAYMRKEFNRLSIAPIPITYEELLADKYCSIMTVMTALGATSAEIQSFLPKVEDKTRRLGYSTKYRVIGDFLERNWQIFESVLSARETLDIDATRAKLKDERGIDIGPFMRLRRI